jgi:hypothetical protein
MKLITLVVFSVTVALIYALAAKRSVRPAQVSKYFTVYPCLAAAYIASYNESNIGSIIAYGVANGGYMLLAAGIVRGRFTAFGLERRAPTIIAGITCAVVGIVLSSMSVRLPN